MLVAVFANLKGAAKSGILISNHKSRCSRVLTTELVLAALQVILLPSVSRRDGMLSQDTGT